MDLYQLKYFLEVARQLSFGGYRPRLMIRRTGDDCDICHLDAEFVMADLSLLDGVRQDSGGVAGGAASRVGHFADWANYGHLDVGPAGSGDAASGPGGLAAGRGFWGDYDV